MIRAIEAQHACRPPSLEKRFASTDYSWYVQLAGADRHV